MGERGNNYRCRITAFSPTSPFSRSPIRVCLVAMRRGIADEHDETAAMFAPGRENGGLLRAVKHGFGMVAAAELVCKFRPSGDGKEINDECRMMNEEIVSFITLNRLARASEKSCFVYRPRK